MKVDLHLHTTASDGKLSPQEMVFLAARLGLNTIAITDHDALDGIPQAMEAARAFPQLVVIPGVEINTDVPKGEVHILGYFIDYRNEELGRTLERVRNARKGRAQGMVAKLAKLGIPISWQRVQELAGDGAVGRLHVAQAMLEKGHISNIREAFDKYIGREGPAYVERERMTPQEAVGLVKRAKGLPVLAHPADIEGVERMVVELKKVGLVGMEVYYNGYSGEVIARMKALARKYNLVATGGSDYHGVREDEIPPGNPEVPYEGVERLMALASQRAGEA